MIINNYECMSKIIEIQVIHNNNKLAIYTTGTTKLERLSANSECEYERQKFVQTSSKILKFRPPRKTGWRYKWKA